MLWIDERLAALFGPGVEQGSINLLVDGGM
jgi:hypothetical protein